MESTSKDSQAIELAARTAVAPAAEEIKLVGENEQQPLTVAGNFNLCLSIKSPSMDYFLLTEDRLESLAGGAESLDMTFAGLAFGCFLSVVGIAIPLYITGSTGKIFAILCGLAPVFLLAAAYLGVKGWGIRNRFKVKLDQLKKESKAVVTAASK